MANIKLNKTWVIELYPEEVRLVLKSLGSRIETEEEKLRAKNLANELTKQRLKESKHLFEEMSKHNANVES